MNGRISVAPSEQLTPTMKGSACSTEIQNASTVCPERFRPERSIAVKEIHSGSSGATSFAATSAAFAFSVSKIVSIMSRSTPPSRRAAICSSYASRTSSNVDRAIGGVVDASGRRESETLSGPTEPATKRGFSGVFAVHASAARRASRAPSRLISAAASSSA